MERKELEKITREYQMLQEQLQSLAVQREQFREQKEELKLALDELEKAKGKIFLSVGGIMVDVDKDTAMKNVKERQESNAMRLTIVERQFDDASKKEKALREDITAEIGRAHV